MERKEVFEAINSEREYQDNAIKSGGTHIVKEFPLGSALSAIQVKLETARNCWYGDVTPHRNTMEELRKIAAICVQMGEQYGMPNRVLTNKEVIKNIYFIIQEIIVFQAIDNVLLNNVKKRYDEYLNKNLKIGFTVVCDESNNPLELRDDGKLAVRILYDDKVIELLHQ